MLGFAAQHVRFTIVVFGVAVVLFAGMLLFFELGRRLGIHLQERHGPSAREGVGKIDSAVFSLLALLIGFTFSGATSRFDARRRLVIEETNTARVAWMRIDALSADAQEPIRAVMRRYLDAVLDSYKHPDSSPEEAQARADVIASQNDLWNQSMTASLAASGEKARMLLLPSLNELVTAVETEQLNAHLHPPLVIYWLLGLTAMAAALFGGYALAASEKRDWFHMVGVAATIAIAMYVILELEFPRNGLIRIDPIDNSLVAFRASMK